MFLIIKLGCVMKYFLSTIKKIKLKILNGKTKVLLGFASGFSHLEPDFFALNLRPLPSPQKLSYNVLFTLKKMLQLAKLDLLVVCAISII